MSIYSNVTEQDLIILRKLSEQQKNQRALKTKNKILKQTQDVKLAESLSPITKNLDEVKETTQELGDVIKKAQSQTPQLAIENSQPPLLKENNQDDTQPGVLYDVDLENTWNKMKDNTGFLKTYHDPQRGWILNNYPIKKSRGSKIKVNENKFNITPGLHKVFTDQSYDTAKSMTDTEKLVFRDILQKTGYYDRKPTKTRLTGRDRYIRNELDNEVKSSNVIDILEMNLIMK